jgi:hypothetical protein
MVVETPLPLSRPRIVEAEPPLHLRRQSRQDEREMRNVERS